MQLILTFFYCHILTLLGIAISQVCVCVCVCVSE